MADAKEAGLIKADLEEKSVQAGHWFLYEIPDQLSDIVIDWLKRKSFTDK
jgi:soluble epoxide hydrolase/lipid-phosphate phosphatase